LALRPPIGKRRRANRQNRFKENLNRFSLMFLSLMWNRHKVSIGSLLR